MREKKYLLREWLFAAVMWAAFSFTLLWLHYKVYGRMLLTEDIRVFWWIIILAPACPLGRWLSQGSLPPEPPDRNSIAVRLYTLFWCLIPACCFYTLLTESYRLAVWLLAAWLVLFVPLHLRRQDKRPAAVGLLFLTGLLVTGAYLLAVQPVSVAQAERMVQQAGYTSLYRFELDRNWRSFETVLDNGETICCALPETTDDPLGYYGFRAYRDGERYCVVLSVARGQIETEQPQAGNTPAEIKETL